MRTFALVVGAIAIFLAVFFAVTALVALIFSIAWNAVVPAVFNGPTLDFWQAFALVFVLNIIGNLLFRRSDGATAK